MASCAHAPKKEGTVFQGAKFLKGVASKGNSLYYYVISELQALEGELDRSLFYLDKAITKNPDSAYLITEKAYQLARQNRLDEASKLAVQAYKQNSEDAELNLLLAKIYSTQKNTSRSVLHYRKAIALDPKNEEAATLLSQKAVGVLKKLIQENPEALSAYFYLGSIYATVEKDYAKAVAAYQKLLDAEPDNPKILQIISEIHLAQKDYRKALEVLTKLMELDPADTAVQARMALLYYELKEIDRAINEFEDLLKANPESDRVLYYLGLLYQEKKDVEKALVRFSGIKPESTFYVDAVIRQVVLLKNLNQMERAFELSKKALGRSPKTPDFYDLVASLYVLNKKYVEAAAILKAGLVQIPNNENLLFSIGVVLEKTGQWEESLRYMKEVIKLNADNVSALNFVGYTYAEHGRNLDEAQSLIERALKLKPDDGYIVDSLAWIYFQKGEYDQAQNLLEKANRLSPDEPTILEHLAEVYLKKQNKKLARRFFEKSLFVLNKKENRDPRDEEQMKRIRERISQL